MFAVNPIKMWPYRVGKIIQKYGLDKATENEALKILDKIYTDMPELHPDAVAFLSYLRGLGLQVILFTHADAGWTDRKIDGLNLRQYFDSVEIWSNEKFKDAVAWQTVIEKIGLPKEQVLAVGDSINTDIRPAVEAGLVNVVWVDRGIGWDVYRNGELPKGVTVVKRLGEIKFSLP